MSNFWSKCVLKFFKYAPSYVGECDGDYINPYIRLIRQSVPMGIGVQPAFVFCPAASSSATQCAPSSRSVIWTSSTTDPSYWAPVWPWSVPSVSCWSSIWRSASSTGSRCCCSSQAPSTWSPAASTLPTALVSERVGTTCQSTFLSDYFWNITFLSSAKSALDLIPVISLPTSQNSPMWPGFDFHFYIIQLKSFRNSNM